MIINPIFFGSSKNNDSSNMNLIEIDDSNGNDAKLYLMLENGIPIEGMEKRVYNCSAIGVFPSASRGYTARFVLPDNLLIIDIPHSIGSDGVISILLNNGDRFESKNVGGDTDYLEFSCGTPRDFYVGALSSFFAKVYK